MGGSRIERTSGGRQVQTEGTTGPASRRAGRPPRRRRGASNGLLISVVGSLFVLGALQVAARHFISRAAEDAGLDRAGEVTARAADVALAPYLTDDLLRGGPETRAALDEAGRTLIAGGEFEHIKIWSADGTVVWSDLNDIIGQTFELEPDDRALLGTRNVTAAVSDLSADEHAGELAARHTRLLEIYYGTTTETGTPLLAETYSSFDLVEEQAARLRATFLPLMTVVLVVLAFGQMALVCLLGRRLARSERRRARLLQRVIDASDSERRRVAAEVHDGVVQDLMGISFALAGAAQAERANPGELHSLAASTRAAVGSLRGLLSSIYPVEVPPEGWLAGLDDVIETLTQQHVLVHFDVDDQPLTPVEELLLLRIAREALRNVAHHAHAQHAIVELVVRDRHIELTIRDDGDGFDSSHHPDGHLGLRLLHDLAADAGGQLSIESQPDHGTTVTFELVSSS